MRSVINCVKVACYLRLSREDGDKLESDSISNQRMLIEDYIKNNPGFTLVQEYVDDGYSGTNFDRPSFKRMLADIDAGRINCIIVKDLSRFGRNYIESGRYIEKIFPALGVRLIALLDNYDSASINTDVDQFIVPFKNLINDSYCRDISNKITSQFEVKRKCGKFIGSFASYGYFKDPKDKNHLIIDPYAADIVRMIFKLKLDGYNPSAICDRLNDLGVLPPAEYKRSLGMDYESGFRTGSNRSWTHASVNKILANEMYTGTMVQGIHRKINYKLKQSRNVPKEDWVRVPGTHDAIVDRSVFDAVQELLKLDTRTSPNTNAVYLFSGLIICGGCGQNMVRKKVHNHGKDFYYYCCNTYKKNLGCTSHLIRCDLVEKAVLTAVQKQLDLFLDTDKFKVNVDGVSSNANLVKVIDNQMTELTKEISRYTNLKASAYNDYVCKVISEEDYKNFDAVFTDRLNKTKDKLQGLSVRKDNLLSKKVDLEPWVKNIREYGNIKSLERSLVVLLIDSVVVNSKDDIVINFKFRDELREYLSAIGGDEE